MKRTFAVALAALAVTAAGCGDDESKDSGGGGAASEPATTQTDTQRTDTNAGGGAASGTIKISADPGGQLKFDKDSLTAKAGKVTIVMDNPSDIPHAVSIEGNGVDKDGKTVQKGGKSTVSADLKAGEYEFYCPVAGHEAAGMKGTLTVE